MQKGGGYHEGFWIGPITLRRKAKPHLENERHKENSLKLCIQEAKFLPPKQRYFCDLCLDRTLYARTTSKPMNESVFWGEEFDLNNLADINMITVNLYKEAEPVKSSRMKKKKKKNELIAYVTIAVSDINSRNDTQKWFSMQPAINGSVLYSTTPNSFHTAGMTIPSQQGNSITSLLKNSGNRTVRQDVPQIRIKARYQSIDILPIYYYTPLKKIALENYVALVATLENVLNVKAKESLAGCLVNITEKENLTVRMLADLVEYEVRILDDKKVVFRSNSIATKSMECYLKLVGQDYLKATLEDFINEVLQSSEETEVDPLKLSNSAELARNQEALSRLAFEVWNRVNSSESKFPRELRGVFCLIRQRLEKRMGSDFCDRLISSSLFLRFICPAILSPCLFGLAQEFPEEERVTRTLTLIAKTIQSLANCSPFEEKETYMHFMNHAFLREEIPNMRNFLHSISTSSLAPRHISNCDAFIDSSYELALLYQLLLEAKDLISEETLRLDLPTLTDELESLHRTYSQIDLLPTVGPAPNIGSNIRHSSLSNPVADNQQKFTEMNLMSRSMAWSST